MNKLVTLALVIIIIAIDSCSPRIALRNDAPNIQSKTETIVDRISFKGNQAQMDKIYVKNSLYTLFYYLNEKYGGEKLDHYYYLCFSDKGNHNSVPRFGDHLRTVYGKTFYEILSDMNSDWQIEIGNAYELSSTNLGAIKLNYLPRSRADLDKEILIPLILRQYQEISNFSLVSPEEANRYNLRFNQTFNKELPVYLIPASTLKSPSIFGETSIGFARMTNESVYHLSVSIALKYDSILSTVPMVHEITHVFMLLPYLPEDIFEFDETNYPARIQELEEFASNRRNTFLLGEGYAQYAAEKISLLNRYCFVSDVNSDIRFFAENGRKFYSVRELMKLDYMSLDKMERFMIYGESESLTRFLVEKYGMEKYKKLLFSSADESSFQTILGENIKELDSDWRSVVFDQ